MTPGKRHHRPARTWHPHKPSKPGALAWHDQDDPTAPKRALPRRVTDGPNTAPLWALAGGIGLSVATILAGTAGGWLLLALTLSVAYAWMPTRDAPKTVSRRPVPTRVSPRMQRLLTEGAGPWMLGAALGIAMVAVGWLSGL